MGTIQEALKELRQQNWTSKNNLHKNNKSLNESIGDEDGDIEVTSFNLHDFYQESCGRNSVNESDEDTVNDDYLPVDTTENDNEAINDSQTSTSELTVGAILSKFKDKDENDIVKVLPVEFNGEETNVSLSFDEDEDGNIVINTTLTPIENLKLENDDETEEDIEDDETIDEALGDEDGDIEVTSFNLHDLYSESLNEEKDPEQKITFENIRKIPGFDNVERKAAMAMVKYAKENNDIDTIQDFKNFLDDNYGKIGVAIQMGNRLNSADFADLVADDKKFADVITKICRKINWIDDDGYYVDGKSDETRANAKKPSITELIRNYIKLADKSENGQKLTYQILDKAYFDNDYSGLGKAI